MNLVLPDEALKDVHPQIHNHSACYLQSLCKGSEISKTTVVELAKWVTSNLGDDIVGQSHEQSSPLWRTRSIITGW